MFPFEKSIPNSHCTFYQTLSYLIELEYFVLTFVLVGSYSFSFALRNFACVQNMHDNTTTLFYYYYDQKQLLYQLLNPVISSMRNHSTVSVLTVQSSHSFIPDRACVFCVDFCFISYSFPFAMSKCWILHVYEACVINHNTFPYYYDQKYLSVRNQSKVPILTVQQFISVSFLSILCSRVLFYFFPFAQRIVGFCMCPNVHDNHNTFTTIMTKNIFIASLRTKKCKCKSIWHPVCVLF